jgi:glycine/D-amino acid oxidase-like deaminating enzyme
MIKSEYVIVGAGFAGAATAYHLARRGITDVVLLEREAIPGFHSSGRNAAMVRQCVPEPALFSLTRDGAAFLRDLPADWPLPVEFKQNGSLLLGSGEGWSKLQHDAEIGRRLGVNVELWTPLQARRHVAALKNAEFDGAVWCATDGVIDIHGLLCGYLRYAAERGVGIHYGTDVSSIRRTAEEGFEIRTNRENIATRTVINAGGAWAKPLAQMAGAIDLPLRPYRRHLFTSPPLDWVSSQWPFVWDVSHDIYFRPEGEGLLLCACDQEELPPGDPPVDPGVRELLAEKIDRYMPGLAGVSIHKYWAGFRTITADGRFVIGWDPRAPGFFWVAGLGGHGVTTSWAVGNLAAELLIAGQAQQAEDFSPARFDA